MKSSGSAIIGALLAASLLLAGCARQGGHEGDPKAVADFAIDYSQPGLEIALPPKKCAATYSAPMSHGSTHEIEPHDGAFWITGQNHDSLVRVTPVSDGAPTTERFALPPGSGPHGIGFDARGRLWLTLEYKGCIVALEGNKVVAAHDVALSCPDCVPAATINSRPHGLDVDPDGSTIWFTGKATGTIGRIAADGKLSVFALPTAGSTPIYIRAGPDGAMWVTELTGNQIARVDGQGKVSEYPIPTPYSRPIAIIPDPKAAAMWFSEEAGSNVARIGMDGIILEYAVPREHPNQILAGLAFDREGNLWVQQYVDHSRPAPAGIDRIVRIDKAGLAGDPGGLKAEHFTFYPVPTRDTVMHRIVAGPGGILWFTEMNADKIGRLVPRATRQ